MWTFVNSRFLEAKNMFIYFSVLLCCLEWHLLCLIINKKVFRVGINAWPFLVIREGVIWCHNLELFGFVKQKSMGRGLYLKCLEGYRRISWSLIEALQSGFKEEWKFTLSSHLHSSFPVTLWFNPAYLQSLPSSLANPSRLSLPPPP